MVTGAAAATINRLPVLLLPGDIFARRNVAPVLQQLESSQTQDVSVNDCFRAVSKYWDRIQRPEQIVTALPEAMRVLTSAAETGAVTLACLKTSRPRRSTIRKRCSENGFGHCSVNGATRRPWRPLRLGSVPPAHPLIIAGGGVLYSEACGALANFASAREFR